MNEASSNKLLKTLTDSIPEELIPNSPSGYSSATSTASTTESTTSPFLTIVMIIFGLIFVGGVLFYLAEISGNSELKEYSSSIKQSYKLNVEPMFQSFLTSLNLETSSIKNLFKKRKNHKKKKEEDSDSGSDSGSDSDDETKKPLRPADGSQPELNPPYKNAPININDVPNAPVNKNARQYAQFNQMQGINSGKRVGQHFSSEEDEPNEFSSLDSMLQSAASAASGALYSADDSNSSVQTKGKAGWCLIGEDKGVRNCIKVGLNDTCLSGDIFPNNQICVNPNLRS